MNNFQEWIETVNEQLTRLDAHAKYFEIIAKTLEEITNRFEKLEKRIASLESKPSESTLDRPKLDFERGYDTKVPTKENESDIERLKDKNNV